MVPVRIKTLIVTAAPSPSIIVLQPEEEAQHDKSRIVPIWIGSTEAAQMGVALERARFTRPMTHDLFLDALTNLDARIDHVVISDMKGPTFFAKLVVRQGPRLVSLDSRPSDALSLAVRQEAPIYMEEHVLERASFPYLFRKATRRKNWRSSARFWKSWPPRTSRARRPHARLDDRTERGRP